METRCGEADSVVRVQDVHAAGCLPETANGLVLERRGGRTGCSELINSLSLPSAGPSQADLQGPSLTLTALWSYDTGTHATVKSLRQL